MFGSFYATPVPAPGPLSFENDLFRAYAYVVIFLSLKMTLVAYHTIYYIMACARGYRPRARVRAPASARRCDGRRFDGRRSRVARASARRRDGRRSRVARASRAPNAPLPPP